MRSGGKPHQFTWELLTEEGQHSAEKLVNGASEVLLQCCAPRSLFCMHNAPRPPYLQQPCGCFIAAAIKERGPQGQLVLVLLKDSLRFIQRQQSNRPLQRRLGCPSSTWVLCFQHMVPFPYQPQEAQSLKGNNQGDSLLLKDIWRVMISWVRVPEFQECKVHRTVRKDSTALWLLLPIWTFLVLGIWFQDSLFRSQTGNNLFIFNQLMNQLTIYSLNIECQLYTSFLLSAVDTMSSKVDFKAW